MLVGSERNCHPFASLRVASEQSEGSRNVVIVILSKAKDLVRSEENGAMGL